MLLDRIDIDSHGPLNRVELGPFSEYLNVICTPEGSGKTAIARFIRDSLIRREYPLGMMSSSAGRVVWADRNGKIHCRREHDGTASGRRTIEFESRGDGSFRFDWLHGSWINGIADSTDASRALETIRIPESIVDGIVTDTAVTSVSRVIQACLAAGLNDPAVFSGLPLNRSSVSGTSPAETADEDTARRGIRDELARVESELATFERPVRSKDSAFYTASLYDHTYHAQFGRPDRHASVQALRDDLQSRLAYLRSLQHSTLASTPQYEHSRSDELSRLHDRIWQLRVRHSELSRWLMNLRSDRNRSGYTAPITSPYAPESMPKPSNAMSPSHKSSWELEKELNQISVELDRCVARAVELRRQTPDRATREGVKAADPNLVRSEIDWILAELRSLDHHPAATIPGSLRLDWLKIRRAQLIEKLGVPRTSPQSGVPLADEASQWLVRLSGGRLRRVDWNAADFTTAPKQIAAASRTGFARIDGREEAACPAMDRALATLAVRLAAGDLLARTGRPIPLVIEAHRELLRPTFESNDTVETIQARSRGGEGAPINLAVIAALDDYAKNGRQLIVLASDQLFAQQVDRRGGKVYAIHGQRLASEHRPLWQPHFAGEHYVGPHAGAHLPTTGADPLPKTDAFVDRYYDQYFDNIPVGATLADINRNLDAIWQEAYGISPDANLRSTAPTPSPVPRGPKLPSSNLPHTTFAPHSSIDAGNWHDGYYFADTYTTGAPADQQRRAQLASARSQAGVNESTARESTGTTRPPSPFFLTVDSPIDQAPSVDAVAAARLRGLDVTHINHLMNQDPNRLADSVGLAGVTAATIRRWQSECRLVCHVPQLRGFDARVLVGCGITDAGHLSSTDPTDLLDRVEAFLATERGQRILLSGTSYELSRITSWIAAANVNTDDNPVTQIRDHQTVDGRVHRKVRDHKRVDLQPDHERYEYEFVDDNGDIVRARSNRQRSTRRPTRTPMRSNRGSDGSGRPSGNPTETRHQNRSSGASTNQSSVARHSGRARFNGREDKTHGDDRRTNGERSGRTRVRRTAGRSSAINSGRTRRTEHDHADSSNQSYRHDSGDHELRFYLQRESQVVDAPSIGARMAARLEDVGITTVDDLLNSDAASLAEALDHRRIDADVITAWQNQAILVCRIPMLRGHDAQLLVAAEVTTPEEVAEYEPEDLFAMIDPIAKSNEGKRILRGGNLPDVHEITQWIHYAGQNRELIAA